MLSRFLPLLLLAFSGAALAGTEPALAVPASEADFGAQRAQIEKKLADGKTYAEIAPGDRQRVTEALQRMSDELAGVANIEQMQTAARTRLFNDQELVNTLLTQAAADSRLVCEHRTPTGSRMKVTTCETVAERERRKQNDQNELQKLQRPVAPLRN
jgi:hypothetical protein